MPIFTLALALGLATPAPQELTEIQKDARCTVVLQEMAASMTDPGQKGAVGGIMLFFMGRLSVQLSPAKIVEAINAAGTALDKSQSRQLSLDCIERMKTLTGIE